MILHLDLDCFFASAHRTLDKSLLDKPIAVGGRSNLKIFETKKVGIKLYDSNSGAFVNPVFYNETKNDFKSFFVDHIGGKDKIRGIITTASYEARDFGIKTAMSINEALQKCPTLKVLTPNYLLYHELSNKLHSFLKDEIPNIEQYSIDEFFGDVGGWIEDEQVLAFAINLQQKIKNRFDLPISIGIAKSKWIAKLATNEAKQNGVCFIAKNETKRFIENIPIEKFAGIGKAYQSRLKKYGITTLGQASRNKSLFYQWKKPGIQLYSKIIGKDNEGISKVNDRKSIGISRTFDPIKDRDEINRRVVIMARHIVYMVFKQDVNPTTYYIGIRYIHKQKAKTRITIDRIFSEQLAKNTFLTLFHKIDIPNEDIVKLSMSVSNFSYQKLKTLSLTDINYDLKEQKLSKSIQKMREKYSLDIIKSANEL